MRAGHSRCETRPWQGVATLAVCQFVSIVAIFSIRLTFRPIKEVLRKTCLLATRQGCCGTGAVPTHGWRVHRSIFRARQPRRMLTMLQRLLLGGLISAVIAVAATGCCVNAGGCGRRSGCGDCGAGGCGILSRVRNSLTCGGGCGELYVDDWHNHPSGPDSCGDCGDGCGNPGCRRPLLTVLRRLWGVRYCGGCETGCSDCGYGGCDHAGGGVEVGHAGCASCGGGHVETGEINAHEMSPLEGEIVEPKLAPTEPKAASQRSASSAYYSRKKTPARSTPTSHRTSSKPRRSRIVPRSPA